MRHAFDSRAGSGLQKSPRQRSGEKQFGGNQALPAARGGAGRRVDAPRPGRSASSGLTIAHTEASFGWGGQEIRIITEMETLRRRGHRLLLAAPASSQVFAQARARGFDPFPLGGRAAMLLADALRLARWFQAQRVDVVCPHSSRDAWRAGLAGRLVRVPLIVRYRHFEVPIASRWLSRVVYQGLADHLVTTSPKITAQFRQTFGFGEERVSTIPTGIDLEVFSPGGNKAELPVPPEQGGWPVVGMVAVLRQAKGHMTLVRAARRLRDQSFPVRLVFVGDGPSKRPIDEEIARQQLADAVLFTGHRDDIPAVLRALDVLAIPSQHEGIPQIALQALACQTPVVGSDVGGIPTVIEPGVTGRIFPAGDDAALAAAIRETIENRVATRAMLERGRAQAEARHGVERMADTVEALYRRCLRGG